MRRKYVSELSPSEENVYKLLLKGFSPYKIAEMLHNEYSTIATHRSRIFQKKYVTTIQELMAQRINELEKELVKFNNVSAV